MVTWFDKDKTYCFIRKVPGIEANIWIGKDPRDGFSKKEANSFDAIINVTDSQSVFMQPSREGQIHHWYPVVEMGEWSYSFLHWIRVVLDHHVKQNHKILVHCSSGVMRSPSAVFLYLYYTGYSLEDALYKSGLNHFNTLDLVLPVKWKEFYKLQKENPTWATSGAFGHIFENSDRTPSQVYSDAYELACQRSLLTGGD